MNASTSVLVRRDQANLPAIFLLESLDVNRDTIKVWNGDDQPPHEVSLTYYKNSRPTSDADEEGLVNLFRSRFNPPGGIALRRRLFKVSPFHPNYVPPKETPKHEQPTTVPFVESKENKAAQQREASPEAAKEATAKLTQVAPQQASLQQWEKMLLAEQITNHFAVAFAKAREEAIREIMKA